MYGVILLLSLLSLLSLGEAATCTHKRVTLNMVGYATINEVYIGNMKFTQGFVDANADTTSKKLEGTGNWIAFKATKVAASNGAILASFKLDGEDVVGTSTAWKCTKTAPANNWFTRDFDDSTWVAAAAYGKNGAGAAPFNTQIAAISTDAFYIWTADAVADTEIYCRFSVSCSASANCGNGKIDGAEECDGGKGCKDDCKCDTTLGFKAATPKAAACLSCFGTAAANVPLKKLSATITTGNTATNTPIKSLYLGATKVADAALTGDRPLKLVGWGDFIAIEVQNTVAGTQGAFLIEFSSGGSTYYTDTTWKCADKAVVGGLEWFDRGFDDSTWDYAWSYGPNDATVQTTYAVVGTISSKANWIWRKDGNVETIVCRKFFLCTSGKCGDGAIAEPEECDSGQGCLDTCKCDQTNGWITGNNAINGATDPFCLAGINANFKISLSVTAFAAIDGLQIGNNYFPPEKIANSDAWATAGSVSGDGDYVAVKVTNKVGNEGKFGGFLASGSFGGGIIRTDPEWKCSATFDADKWWRRNYDDAETWKPAVVYGFNDGKSSIWPKKITDVTQEAAWIWADNPDGNTKDGQTIVCRRRYVYAKSPCGNSVRDEGEECDGGKGCTQSCKCDIVAGYTVDNAKVSNTACILPTLDKNFAIGNAKSFAFFFNKQYCTGMNVERPITYPGFLPVSQFSCLTDPLKLNSASFRTFDEVGWDALGGMSFAISYTLNNTKINEDNNRTGFTLSERSVVNAEGFCGVADSGLDESTLSTFSGSTPVISAGQAKVNKIFYWEAIDKDKHIKVRVTWNCKDDKAALNKCTRTITVKNINNLYTAPGTANQTLFNVDIYLGFDWDITPTPQQEQIAFGTVDGKVPGDKPFEELKGFAAVRSVRQTEWPGGKFDSKARFAFFNSTSTDQTSCWKEGSANKNYKFSDNPVNANKDIGCDGGCSVQIRLAKELLPQDFISIDTDLTWYKDEASAQKGIEDVKKDKTSAFYCMGANNVKDTSANKEANNRVIASYTYRPYKNCVQYTKNPTDDIANPQSEKIDLCYVPGDCICANKNNANMCSVDVLDKTCKCDPRKTWGSYCQRTCPCGEHGQCADQNTDVCTCDAGWCGPRCENQCNCGPATSGKCKPETCECLCLNLANTGRHGLQCERDWNCKRVKDAVSSSTN